MNVAKSFYIINPDTSQSTQCQLFNTRFINPLIPGGGHGRSERGHIVGGCGHYIGRSTAKCLCPRVESGR